MRILIALVVGSAGVAAAGPSQIVGKVIDSHGHPIAAATITLGTEHVTTTPEGVYRVVVPGPGKYKLAFDYADAHVDREITVEDPLALLDASLPIDSESTIVIHDARPIAKPPERSDDPSWSHQARYSDEALLTNRWAKAWLLLDVDVSGHVTRLKLLNDPGNDLGPIAIEEGFKMTFSPALDSDNHAMPTLIVVPVEWPSYSWTAQIRRWRTPSQFANRNQYMACRGDGPMTMDSVAKEYRDCTPPDIASAAHKKWITR